MGLNNAFTIHDPVTPLREMLRSTDRDWIRRALLLALRGLGSVEPNPMVGCVLVHDGKLVGEGWHERFGGPHAEIMAIRSATRIPKGSTAYVTLEPCCHHGKTPPCAGSLIQAGIRRVVYGCKDPNPMVSGGGVAALEAAGLELTGPVLEAECRDLLAPYLMLTTKQRPWVIVKSAVSLDGKIATASGESKWITSPAAREHAHSWRARVDAIVVGIGTVLADNPILTPRPTGPRMPIRVVLDRTGRLPIDSALAQTAREAPVIVVTSNACNPVWLDQVEKCGEIGRAHV